LPNSLQFVTKVLYFAPWIGPIFRVFYEAKLVAKQSQFRGLSLLTTEHLVFPSHACSRQEPGDGEENVYPFGTY